jgi:hypothetical protein
MPNAPENNLPLTAGEFVKEPAELDEGGCFEPFIPQVASSPAPKPVPNPKPPSLMPVIDKILRDNGCVPTPTNTSPEPEFPAPETDGSGGAAETAQPSENPPAPVESPLPPPRVATAVELFKWVKASISAQTHLPEDATELLALWVISTHVQEALTILPCLILTGSAHDAGNVLHILGDFCRKAVLLAGFRRCDLGGLRVGYETNLISEPNLDKRIANLLSSLTDRRFLVVDAGLLTRYSKSTAIYAGENPEPHMIQNSIHIHIAPTNAAPIAPPKWLREMIARVPIHLDQYRNKNLGQVHRWTWVPCGLSSETAAIATALGRGIVDAPELQQKLIVLLKNQDQECLSEMSNTAEAVVLEATRTLSRDGREHAYAKEIAAEANCLMEVRGETARLTPEKVGHQLKKLGLRSHRLSQIGNGLTFDKATVAKIQQLAAMYLMEDTPAETENLHGSQATDNN